MGETTESNYNNEDPKLVTQFSEWQTAKFEPMAQEVEALHVSLCDMSAQIRDQKGMRNEATGKVSRPPGPQVGTKAFSLLVGRAFKPPQAPEGGPSTPPRAKTQTDDFLVDYADDMELPDDDKAPLAPTVSEVLPPYQKAPEPPASPFKQPSIPNGPPQAPRRVPPPP